MGPRSFGFDFWRNSLTTSFWQLMSVRQYLLLVACICSSVAADAQRPRVTVGRNVRLSSVEAQHRELMLDAAPWDPDVLIGTGVEYFGGEPFGPGSYLLARRNLVFTTTDEGKTWRTTVVPGLGADPQVAAGQRGTLLYAGLRIVGSTTGLVVMRSTDFGVSWSELSNIGDTDHPQLAVDHSDGPYKGRAYIAGKACEDYRAGHLCLWKSLDDGKTWERPIVYRPPTKDSSHQSITPIIFSDGMLMLPYSRQYRLPDEPATTTKKGHMNFQSEGWFVTSNDGGETFGEYKYIWGGKEGMEASALQGHPEPLRQPMFAVDRSNRHKDRLYMVWCSHNLQKGRTDRVFVIYSDDRGQTWSKPVLVDRAVPARARQWMPTITVNKNGVVAVRWSDTRHDPKPPSKGVGTNQFHDEYFAASVDGGASFLPAVRVSTQSSVPSLGKSVWITNTSVRGDSALLFADGPGMSDDGDYLGFVADGRGVFWTMWSDTRTGVRHIYTASIRVDEPGRREVPSSVVSAELEPGMFRVEIDPTKYDVTGSVVEVPVRVRNLSSKPIYAPMRLTVKVVPPGEPLSDIWVSDSTTEMTLLNGLKSRAGSSARVKEFDLSSVLHGRKVLLPGEKTEPIVLRLKVPKDPTGMNALGGRLGFEVTARVEKAK
jgi:hypothetical protein